MAIMIKMWLTCDKCGYEEDDTYLGDDTQTFNGVEREAETLGFEFIEGRLLCVDCNDTDN